jgi:hypothetical protein
LPESADVRAGRVPQEVQSFGHLHDHVDANEYGGFCIDDLADAMIVKLKFLRIFASQIVFLHPRSWGRPPNTYSSGAYGGNLRK